MTILISKGFVMKRISKIEKDLLLFAASTTMGLVSVSSGSEAGVIAWRLCQRQLFKRSETNLPFCGSRDYYSLTKEGWAKAKKLSR
jgi:hypothetical protein